MTRGAGATPAVGVERCSKEAYRLLLDGRIIGFALLLTNGRWIHTDPEDRRQGASTYASPRDVAKALTVSLAAAPRATTG